MTALTGIFIGLFLIGIGFLLGRMQADQSKRDKPEAYYDKDVQAFLGKHALTRHYEEMDG